VESSASGAGFVVCVNTGLTVTFRERHFFRCPA